MLISQSISGWIKTHTQALSIAPPIQHRIKLSTIQLILKQRQFTGLLGIVAFFTTQGQCTKHHFPSILASSSSSLTWMCIIIKRHKYLNYYWRHSFLAHQDINWQQLDSLKLEGIHKHPGFSFPCWDF